MSFSNQNGQTASTPEIDGHSSSVMNDFDKLEMLIPKDLSSNKQAVIERLVTLYQQKSSDR